MGCVLAERAWETVDELARDEDAAADYRSLTKRLQAVSEPAAGSPFGSSPDAHQGMQHAFLRARQRHRIDADVVLCASTAVAREGIEARSAVGKAP